MSPSSERTVGRTCPLCEATCGLRITLREPPGAEARVVKVTGDPDDVFSRGFICPKGAALGALHHDPDRLKQPRIRGGEAWREVSWDDAFAYIDARLRPILADGDRDALAAYVGNPNVHNLSGMIYGPALLRALGTRNLYSASTVDQMPRHVASGLMYGSPDRIPVPDVDRTDLLLIFGANPAVSNGSLATAPDWPGRISAIRARGGRVVLFDPRRTATAKLADTHHAIRPGTDAALMLAMAHVIFTEGRISLGRLAPHVKDADAALDAIRDAIVGRKTFAPDAIGPICGIAPDVIRALARDLADARRAAVYGRIGTQATRFGTLASWTVDLLNLITGHLDEPGGAMFPEALHERPSHGKGRGFRIGRRHGRVAGDPEVRGELPAVRLADEITTPGPGRIRALFTVAGNPVLSVPDGPRLDAALAGVELMVSIDPYLNETTRRAHVILPPPGPLHRPHYDAAFYTLSLRNVARFSPVVLPHGGVSECDILARLTLMVLGMGPDGDPALVEQQIIGHILGKACQDPGQAVHGRDPRALAAALHGDTGVERAIDALIRTGPRGEGFGADPDGWTLEKLAALPGGVDFGPLEPRLPGALSTPDGMIDAFPDAIRDDIPRLEAWLADAPTGLLLIGRRHLRSNNSWMHNLPKLARGRDRFTLRLHPDDAAARAITDGDRVVLAALAAEDARVEAIAQVTDEVMRGVVSLPHGWGHAIDGTGLRVAAGIGGPNVNRVTRPVIDPLSGNAALNGVPVEVRAIPR